jgi:mono/diheme cytochrome c family protein
METPRQYASQQRKVRWLIVLLVLAALLAYFGWYKFFREEPQPDWVTATPEMRFKYGSIGAEYDSGIPYWIFYVMPRVFADKLPKPGGLASLGIPWEQGQELPVGFTKRTIGFPRVANNCAVCHTVTYRTKENENPTFVVAGPAHTNVQGYFRFLMDCAKDPRFDADVLMPEINLVTNLSWLDQAIYRFVLIPMTRSRLLGLEKQFQWIYRTDFPQWGRGRDDAMNLTKYFMIQLPMDNTFGPTDMPAIWNLRKYEHPGTTLNWAGDTYDYYSVIVDSALGLLGAAPHDKADFLGQVNWLVEYLREVPPPKYPEKALGAIDAKLSEKGKAIYGRLCAICHEGDKAGTRMPLSAVGTDPERLKSWNAEAAKLANQVVAGFGITRRGLVEMPLEGYDSPFLDGIWLRAPYLHNGSVPTLRDLLKPASERPKSFWRGYDVYDPKGMGFISTGPEAQRAGTLFEVWCKENDKGKEIVVPCKSNGNQGHEYGTGLTEPEKDALLEYMKTL